MKRHSGMLATFAAALLLPLGAMAAEPAEKPESQSPTETQVQDEQGKKAQKKAEKPCTTSTASRIRRDKADTCGKESQPTRTYSREEIESTGQTDTAEALRRLDPRFH